MTDLKSVFSHSPDIVTRKTGSEYVLVPVANNIADMNSVYTLNETGAFIWELMDGTRNVEEIINRFVEEYNIDSETATADIFEFAENLKEYLIIK
jgi:methyltransferase-like protein